MRGPSQAFTFPRSHFKSPGEKSPGKNARTKLEGRKYNVPHGNHNFSCLWFGYLESRKHISRKRKTNIRALQEYKARTSWQIKILSLFTRKSTWSSEFLLIKFSWTWYFLSLSDLHGEFLPPADLLPTNSDPGEADTYHQHCCGISVMLDGFFTFQSRIESKTKTANPTKLFQ